MLPSCQKLILGLLATIVPFCVYVPFSVLLTYFKCILEFVFCEGAQHSL
jgi:hypothetical protein